MKKLILGLATLTAVLFTACEDNDDRTVLTVDFEDVTLNEAGLAQSDSVSGSIESGDATVSCSWSTSSYEYDGVTYTSTIVSGFSVTNHTDITTAGYTNMYSCYAGTGANASQQYVTYNSSSDSIKFQSPVDLESVMLCNNTYAYLAMKDGNDGYTGETKFESGDNFYITLSFYDVTNNLIDTEDFYLADYSDGTNSIVSDWAKMDLSEYEDVSYIKFALTSTDPMTPSYFCLDNLSYYAAE